MELKQVTQLMLEMEKRKIRKLTIKEEKGYELTLEREVEQKSPVVYHSAPLLHHEPHHHPLPSLLSPEQKPVSETSSASSKAGPEARYITAPMVGTFYSAPSPEDSPFVKPGDQIQENSVVCLIEAMKVMNELKAGVPGVIAEVLVRNGQPVEFGTKIFRVI